MRPDRGANQRDNQGDDGPRGARPAVRLIEGLRLNWRWQHRSQIASRVGDAVNFLVDALEEFLPPAQARRASATNQQPGDA